MKKIISQKKYDTETADLIGSYQFSCKRDFKYYREELYRKKTGEFFLYGEGGPSSPYREYLDGHNCFCEGAKIIPFSAEEAKSWAERCLSVEEYEGIFGEVQE